MEALGGGYRSGARNYAQGIGGDGLGSGSEALEMGGSLSAEIEHGGNGIEGAYWTGVQNSVNGMEGGYGSELDGGANGIEGGYTSGVESGAHGMGGGHGMGIGSGAESKKSTRIVEYNG